MDTEPMAISARGRPRAGGIANRGVLKSLAEYAEELERRAAAISRYREPGIAEEG